MYMYSDAEIEAVSAMAGLSQVFGSLTCCNLYACYFIRSYPKRKLPTRQGNYAAVL